jgi:2-oxoglutarate ferredoxin oxidoreductase subunit alpha
VTLLVSYGVTARAMAEAVRASRAAGRPISALTIHSVWPVPEDGILAALCSSSCGTAIRRVVVGELNLGDFRREVERVIFGWAARTSRPAPEIVGLNRVDGELITPGQFIATIL